MKTLILKKTFWFLLLGISVINIKASYSMSPVLDSTIKQQKLIGTVWQMQIDEKHEKGGVLNNISFGSKGIMYEVSIYYNDGSLTKIGEEKQTIYRESVNEVLVFDDEGIKKKITKKIKWISENEIIFDGYYYARLGSDKDIFSKDYTEKYVEKIVTKGLNVYPIFLEFFAEPYRSVDGKTYKLSKEYNDPDAFVIFEFGNDGITCHRKTSKKFSLETKEYYDSNIGLSFRNKAKLFSDGSKRDWDENWTLKWINSQEFILSKDGKSYKYYYVGRTVENQSSSY